MSLLPNTRWRVMIVPQYWAEARNQQRGGGRQVTVRRFGWSDVSQAEAEAMAERRAAEAAARTLAGERLPRREPKVPYNGAAGVPIREEVLARHGEAVITRNSYGARCLNVPDTLIADIDFTPGGPFWLDLLLLVALVALAALVGWWFYSVLLGVVLAVLAVVLAGRLARAAVALAGGVEQIARRRIERFLARNPDWALRLYRTPAGLRLVATHRPFAPSEPVVQDFFRAVRVDRIYARMCLRQQCFRARLTAKPWRIGIDDHLKPRPGVWPVQADRLPERAAWVAHYEEQARGYAACAFVESWGSGQIDPRVEAVVALHDRQCRATEDLPLA